jgi:hypothetical protein
MVNEKLLDDGLREGLTILLGNGEGTEGDAGELLLQLSY